MELILEIICLMLISLLAAYGLASLIRDWIKKKEEKETKKLIDEQNN